MDSKFALDTIKKSFVGGKGTIYPNEWETIRADLESQTTAVQQLKLKIAALATEIERVYNEDQSHNMGMFVVSALRQLSSD